MAWIRWESFIGWFNFVGSILRSWNFNADDEISGETYDANGNVLSTGGKSFTYDFENHLMSMTASGKSVDILYDGDGNRVAKDRKWRNDPLPGGRPESNRLLTSCRGIERSGAVTTAVYIRSSAHQREPSHLEYLDAELLRI